MEYYSSIRRKKTGSLVEMWTDSQSVILSELCKNKQNKHHILMNVYRIYRNSTDEPSSRAGIEMQI